MGCIKNRLLIIVFTANLVLGISINVIAGNEAGLHIAPTGEGEPSQMAGSVRLVELIQEALERNPTIQAAGDAASAKRAIIPAVQTMPDPILGFQHMGDLIPPDLQQGDPSSARIYSIEQEIPFPGKLGLKGKIAETEYETENWNLKQTRLKVVSDLKVAYYDLYLIDKSIGIVRENKSLLAKFTQITETKYQLGQGIQQDVIKAHVEISKLTDRLTVLEQRRSALEAEINSLLYRPLETPLGNPVEINKTAFTYSPNELYEITEKNSPALHVQEQEINRNQHRVELARKEFYPDFTFGFSYFDRTVPEMYGVMVNVKVPLYFWRKQSPELQSATLAARSARKQYDGTMTVLSSKIKSLYLQAHTSERLIELYRTGIIPQARLSLESAVAGYQVGSVDFLTVIDSFTTLLEFRLRYHEVLTDFQKALAQLEPYVGIELAL